LLGIVTVALSAPVCRVGCELLDLATSEMSDCSPLCTNDAESVNLSPRVDEEHV